MARQSPCQGSATAVKHSLWSAVRPCARSTQVPFKCRCKADRTQCRRNVENPLKVRFPISVRRAYVDRQRGESTYLRGTIIFLLSSQQPCYDPVYRAKNAIKVLRINRLNVTLSSFMATSLVCPCRQASWKCPTIPSRNNALIINYLRTHEPSDWLREKYGWNVTKAIAYK